MMHMKYDKKVDAIYISLSDKKCAVTKKLDDMRYVDYAQDGSPVGVELLGVSSGVETEDLPNAAEIARLLEGRDIKIFA